MDQSCSDLPSPWEAAGSQPSAPGVMAMFIDCVVAWGRATIAAVVAVGQLTRFMGQIASWLLSSWPRRDLLLPCFYQIGVLSLPVVAVTGTFFGMIIAVQCFFQFRAVGLESRLGAVINMTLVRELGPVLAAVMLAGRVGSAMAAELGTMRVTEQINALASMGANPIRYLVVPRFLACVILVPTLTLVADFVGVIGGYFYSVIVLEIDPRAYWHHSAQFVGSFDVLLGVFKSFFFGTAIAVISCHQGFHCGAGAEGVGKAATTAFVHCFVSIITLDLLLGMAMNAIYSAFWPQAASIL